MTRAPGKADLRGEARARLRALSASEKAEASARLLAQLIALPAWQGAATVGLYASLPGEPATRPIFETARHQKPQARLMLPRMRPPSGIDLHLVRDWERDLSANELGILEPRPERCPLLPPSELDLVLVPGLGFDAAGHRLGRGGGYYDRLLGRVSPTCQRIGLFFACQEFAALPTEPHDQSVQPLSA